MDKLYWESLNKREYIYWKGFCSDDRIISMSRVEEVVSQYGFIIDFHMFSDLDTSLLIELEEKNIDRLYAGLLKYITLNEREDLNSQSKEERFILLNITFIKGTGNLRIEVPSVPG